MAQDLRSETETCPCPVCRSDMAYIHPCESPIVVIPMMEIDDLTPKNKSIEELISASYNQPTYGKTP